MSARSEILIVRQSHLSAIVNHLASYLSFQQRKDQAVPPHSSKVIPRGHQPRHRGYFITLLYSVTKCFYTSNSLVLLFILNFFLRTDYQLFGVQMLTDLLNGRQWEESGHFPRVTLCDLTIREVGQTHRHTVQCVLVINLFSEKIFIFLWFYFAILALVNLVDTTMVLNTSHRRSQCEEFLARYFLPLLCDTHYSGSPQLRSFFDEYLRWDGIFVLRRIESRAGELVCSEVVRLLYERYANPDPKINLDRSPMDTIETPSKYHQTNSGNQAKTYRLIADSLVSHKSTSNRVGKKLPKFRYQNLPFFRSNKQTDLTQIP